eukprot:gnl/TRDRNA2_/TRDRNA2_30389_c0_seq1.p1 gnl/TRDRNA2_/TRDRNA2_30389_c0~~gnl/TRDRNA2_/TRDRNA2_30389_c0_seq1.p1  ORF type:complete len:382 (+),score=29.04 gnl/TRDRNA2_/TRDRNA2_30389_c0_seq1:26-1147(+)
MALPRTWAGTYHSDFYKEMVADTVRTEAYAQALQEVVRDGDVVVDIGAGPFAILACQAAQAGAGRVFAIEVDCKAAKAARQFLSASCDSWTSKIELHQGASANVILPVGADLIVHELIGLIAGCEGAAAILRDAFARHVKQSPRVAAGIWSVPARARSWLVPVEMPTREQLLARGSAEGLYDEPFPQGKLVMAFDNFPFASCAIAHPQYFEVLDFARLPTDPTALIGKRTRRLMFVSDRPSEFAGFAIFITGEMTPCAVASADAAETQAPASCSYFSPDAPAPGVGFCSAWQDSHWGNPFIRLNLVSGGAMHVERGDVIEMDATVDLTPFQPMYALRAALRQQRGEKVHYTEVLNGILEQKLAHASCWQLSST